TQRGIRKSVATVHARPGEASQTTSTENSSWRDVRLGRCWIWAMAPQPTTPRRTGAIGRLLSGLSGAGRQVVPEIGQAVERGELVPQLSPHPLAARAGPLQVPRGQRLRQARPFLPLDPRAPPGGLRRLFRRRREPLDE